MESKAGKPVSFQIEVFNDCEAEVPICLKVLYEIEGIIVEKPKSEEEKESNIE